MTRPEPSADTVDERTCLIGRTSGYDSSCCTSTSHDLESREENGLVRTESPEPSSGSDYHVQWEKSLVLLASKLLATATILFANIHTAVFLVNSETAVCLAIFRQIASDFNALGSASWIVNSSIVGLIVAQPIV